MKHTFVVALVGAAVAMSSAMLLASDGRSVRGKYVEARTAEVFTGGCVMNSEAETMGRQAVLAWKVDRGQFNGVPLDGLSVVAALSGDKNLGMVEMGGDKPHVRLALFVDERANPAQRIALIAMASELSRNLLGTIVQVMPVAVQFSDRGGAIDVAAGPASLDVDKHVAHDPSCGAMQWFHPLSAVEDAAVGLASQHTFTGSSLGTRWSHPNRRSAFFGTFSVN